MNKKYNKYLKQINNDKISKRYKGKEHYFHASSAGLCIRKHYFGSIEKIKPTPPEGVSLTRLRLGDLVHEDIQSSLNGDRYLIEDEIILEDLNVRGHYDILDRKKKKLIDIKTVGGYKWKMIFGRDAKDSVENYKLQLGTYGLGIQKKYDIKLKEMCLLFYKLGDPKATEMRELNVPLFYIKKAKEYWKDVNEKTKSLPELSIGSAPSEGWECNPSWCGYFEHCGGGLKPELLRS
jgi:hypothetical protein